MAFLPIHLAVEDDLSEAALRRILHDRDADYDVRAVYKKNGFGYLKKNIHAFNRAARHVPFLLLTDLDNNPCPTAMIQEWLRAPQHPNFLFRVAIHEVEAWMLADLDALCGFLGARRKPRLPAPETIEDAKEAVLRIAMRSQRRPIKESMARRARDGRITQGPIYNATMAKFVRTRWRPWLAARNAPSLSRLEAALDRLEDSWR